jgi:hypothetical protein
MAENQGAGLKTSQEIWQWMALPSLNGRGFEHANLTGEPLTFPDACKHPSTALILGEEDEIYCFLCGCRPPRYFSMKPDY